MHDAVPPLLRCGLPSWHVPGSGLGIPFTVPALGLNPSFSLPASGLWSCDTAPVSLRVLICETRTLHSYLERAAMRRRHQPQQALRKQHLLCPPLSDLSSSFWTKGQLLATSPLVLFPGLELALGVLQWETTQGEPLASLVSPPCQWAVPLSLAEDQPQVNRLPPTLQDICLQVTRVMVMASSVSRCSSELPTVVPFHTKPRMEGDNGLLSRTFHTPQLLSTSSAILWPNLFEHPALASPPPGRLPRLASAILGYALTSSPNGQNLACSDLLPLFIKSLLRVRYCPRPFYTLAIVYPS